MTYSVLCKKDFFMQDGEKEFSAGKYYTVVREQAELFLLIDDSGGYHHLGHITMKDYFNWPVPCTSLKCNNIRVVRV